MLRWERKTYGRHGWWYNVRGKLLGIAHWAQDSRFPLVRYLCSLLEQDVLRNECRINSEISHGRAAYALPIKPWSLLKEGNRRSFLQGFRHNLFLTWLWKTLSIYLSQLRVWQCWWELSSPTRVNELCWRTRVLRYVSVIIDTLLSNSVTTDVQRDRPQKYMLALTPFWWSDLHVRVYSLLQIQLSCAV